MGGFEPTILTLIEVLFAQLLMNLLKNYYAWLNNKFFVDFFVN